mmetsp:Transcript_7187/g.13135  ORF Transcript_7187/g.13135 Transcript_7187/m.13135 type:complete len:225 (-) Transcript_7187:652-1326(-)
MKSGMGGRTRPVSLNGSESELPLPLESELLREVAFGKPPLRCPFELERSNRSRAPDTLADRPKLADCGWLGVRPNALLGERRSRWGSQLPPRGSWFQLPPRLKLRPLCDAKRRNPDAPPVAPDDTIASDTTPKPSVSSLRSRFRSGVVLEEGSKPPPLPPPPVVRLVNADVDWLRTIPRPSAAPPPPSICVVPNSPKELQRLCPSGVRRPPRAPTGDGWGLRRF